LRSLYKGLKGAAIKGLELTDPWLAVANLKASQGKLGVYAIIRAEQAPNPESRITLANEKDVLNMPLAKLDWQFSEIDKRSVRVLVQTLGEEYESTWLEQLYCSYP